MQQFGNMNMSQLQDKLKELQAELQQYWKLNKAPFKSLNIPSSDTEAILKQKAVDRKLDSTMRTKGLKQVQDALLYICRRFKFSKRRQAFEEKIRKNTLKEIKEFVFQPTYLTWRKRLLV